MDGGKVEIAVSSIATDGNDNDDSDADVVAPTIAQTPGGVHMDKQGETLKELRTVIAAQQELLRIALYMMTQGPIVFSDQELKSEAGR